MPPWPLEFSEAGTPTWSPTRDLSVRPHPGQERLAEAGASWAQVVGGKLEGRAVSTQLRILYEIATMVPTGPLLPGLPDPLHQAPGPYLGGARARGAALGLTLTTAQHGGSPVRIRPGTVLNLDLSQGADGAYTLAPGYVDLSGVDLGAAEDVPGRPRPGGGRGGGASPQDGLG